MKNLIWILMCLFLASCAVIKDAKDNKAVGRVLSSPSLTDRVYKVAVGLHPVFPDKIYIKGKDSTVYDSIPYPMYIDSLIIKDCPKLNLDSLKRALSKTIYIFRTDTLHIRDTTLLRLYEYEKDKNSFISGQLLEKDKTIDRYVKSYKRSALWNIGLSVIMIIVIIGSGYLLFKKKT